MSRALLRHTWRSHRVRLLLVCVAALLWGGLLPVIYARFGSSFRGLLESGALPAALANIGGGDIFSLSGAIALGFIHPIAIILVCIFAVGFATSSVAGERQRGTLEILLSHPLSRRRVYATLLFAALAFVALVLTALLCGALVSASLSGVIGEIELGRVPLAWLDAFLLFGSLSTIALAASVSCDRLSRALGVTLAFVLVSYFLEILGSLWPDAAFLQRYSLFHYLETRRILTGNADPFAFAVLIVVAIAAIGLALLIFPRRDLAAPT
jgi:ABC-2 type transport system permease protein